MRRRLIAATLLVSALLAPTQPAFAFDSWKTGLQFENAFQFGTAAEAKRTLGNLTILVKFGTYSGELAKVIPIASTAVLYFNPNGTVLGWSSKTDTVEAGKWAVRGNGNNDLCLFFPEGKGAGVCTMIFAYGAPFKEATAGNPFNLKAEKPAPYHLGRFGLSLKSIAKKLGI